MPNSATSPRPTRLSLLTPPPVSTPVREYSTAAGSNQPVGVDHTCGIAIFGSGGRGFGGGAGAFSTGVVFGTGMPTMVSLSTSAGGGLTGGGVTGGGVADPVPAGSLYGSAGCAWASAAAPMIIVTTNV